MIFLTCRIWKTEQEKQKNRNGHINTENKLVAVRRNGDGEAGEIDEGD